MEQLPEAGQTPEAPPSSSHSQHLTAKLMCCQAEDPPAEPRASGRALRQKSVWPGPCAYPSLSCWPQLHELVLSPPLISPLTS